MPLNPLIPLSVQPPQHADPLDAMGKMLQVRSMQSSADANDLRAKTAQEQYDESHAVEALIRGTNGDVRKALPEIQKRYPLLGSKLAADIETHDQAMDKGAFEMSEAKRKRAKDEYADVVDNIRQFRALPPDLQTAQAYMGLFQSWKSKNISLAADDKDGNGPLPNPLAFDPARDLSRLDIVAAYGENEKARLDRIDAAEKAKAAPLQTSTAAAENVTKWEEVAGRIGGNVSSPATLATYRQQMKDAPAQVFAQIPTTYDPAAWARYLESTRTQEQRVQSREKQAQLGFEREKMFGSGGDAAQAYYNAQRPDATTGDKVDPRLNMTPNRIFQEAMTWALMGPNAVGSGRGTTGVARLQRDAVTNKGAAMAAAAGVDLPTLRAEYKANAATYGKLFNAYSFTAAAAYTADQALGLAQAQSPNVPRTGSPIANRFLQWVSGHELTGNPALSEFETYIYTASREYAKTVSGGAQSAAQLNVSAAAAADHLINAAQTPAAFDATVSAMRADMGKVTEGQNRQIAGISSTIANFLAAATGDPTAATAAPIAAAPPVGGGATGATQVPAAVRADLQTKAPGIYQQGLVIYRKNADGSIDMFRAGGK